MVTIQWLVYMIVVCCACLGVLFLIFSFMAKQVAKQTAKHKDKITFIRSLISLITESLKKSNHWKLFAIYQHCRCEPMVDLCPCLSWQIEASIEGIWQKSAKIGMLNFWRSVSLYLMKVYRREKMSTYWRIGRHGLFPQNSFYFCVPFYYFLLSLENLNRDQWKVVTTLPMRSWNYWMEERRGVRWRGTKNYPFLGLL